MRLTRSCCFETAQRCTHEAINWPATGSTSVGPFDGPVTIRLTSFRLGLHRMPRQDARPFGSMGTVHASDSDPQKRTEHLGGHHWGDAGLWRNRAINAAPGARCERAALP